MSEFAGATWRHRLETLIATLRFNSGITLIDAQIAPPATEAQIAAATAAAGFELSPAFLAYFRSANGCRISWVERAESSRDAAIATWRQFRQEGGTFGAIDIPPIEVLCARPAHPSFGGGSPGYQLPVLGGWEDSELRLALRDFDRIDALLGQDETPFRGIAMVLHPRFPTPVLLMTEDSGAALADRWPMDACSYLELVALDGGTRLKESWFKAEGYAANHPIISFSRAELGDCFQGSNDWDERFRQMEREQRIKRRVGILPPLPAPEPEPLEMRRWVSEKKVKTTVLLPLIEALGLHEKVIAAKTFTSLPVRPRGVIDLVGNPVTEVEANLPSSVHARLATVLEGNGFKRA